MDEQWREDFLVWQQQSYICFKAATELVCVELQLETRWERLEFRDFHFCRGTSLWAARCGHPAWSTKAMAGFCGQTLRHRTERRDLSPWETSCVWGCLYINVSWFKLFTLCECAPFCFGAHLSRWAVHCTSLSSSAVSEFGERCP